MKKAYWIYYALSLCLCIVGIACRDRLNILDKLLVLLGAALFLITFARHCISKALRCPNCNTVIYTGHIRTVLRQQDGLVKCDKCGSLVRVKHSKGKLCDRV